MVPQETVLLPVEGMFCVETEVKVPFEEVPLCPLLVQVTIKCHKTVLPNAGAVAVTLEYVPEEAPTLTQPPLFVLLCH